MDRITSIIKGVLKLKLVSEKYFYFYADPSFLYGHVNKYLRNFLLNEPIKLNQHIPLLRKLPLVIYYNNVGESQMISKLASQNIVDVQNVREPFEKAIKEFGVLSKLEDIPYTNGFINPKIVKEFRECEKSSKSEDAFHLMFGRSINAPIIVGEIKEKLERSLSLCYFN